MPQSAAAATFTWTGGSAVDSNWTTADNWGGAAPGGTGTDDLVFPDGAARIATSSNDFPAATTFNSIQFSGTTAGYTLSGNQVTLGTGGISSANTSATNTVNFAVVVDVDRTITVTDAAGNLTISGIISGSGGVTKAGPGQLTVGGVNTFIGGLIIKAGKVLATTSNKALGGATGTGTVTLGDTSGSADATLIGSSGNLTFANPIVLATGTIGTLTVGYEGTTSGSLIFTGGVTGTNNLTIKNNSSGYYLHFKNNSINNIGTITINSGTGPVYVSGGVGSNVTAITQSSTTSGLTIDTNPITVNSGGTTLTTSPGGQPLIVSGGVVGTGNLILNNNGPSSFGIWAPLGSGLLNNNGTIINSGSGTGSVLIYGGVGSNVTAITQSSATSALTFYTNPITVNSGGTTLTNTLGGKQLFVYGGVAGTGNLILNNNSSLGGGIYLSGKSLNNIGTITNSGSGMGLVFIYGGVGSNVTAITQSSTTSQLNVDTNPITVNSGGTTLTNSLGGRSLIVRSGVAGTGNLILNNNSSLADGIQFSQYAVNPVNNIGTITNSGSGTGSITIYGGVGSNVTAITQNSTTSQLNVATKPITVNSGGTTLTNSLGGAMLRVAYCGVDGTGDLILNNNSSLSGGITIIGSSTTSVNNTGTITNSGSGTGATIISEPVLSNVTGIEQNSTTSPLTLSGANTFTGGVTLNSGTLNINSSTALGDAAGTFTINGGTIDNTSAGAITTNNYPIDIAGSFSFAGTNDLNFGTGKANILGSPTITTSAGTLTFGDLTTTTDLTFAGSGTLDVSGTFTDNTPASILTFNPGSTYSFANININGTVGNNIIMTSPGTWFFNVAQADPTVSQVSVDHSDATGGNTITATGNSINNGDNTNWLFPPDVPTIGTAMGGDAQATVTFTAPASDGGSAITGYTVTSLPAGGVDSDAGTLSLSHTVTGLTNGTSYTFTVTATSGIGESAPSAESNAVTPATIPDAPTIGTAAGGDAQATITFTAPASDGGSAITGYTVTSLPAGGADEDAGTLSLSHTVIGLSNGTSYTFTVTATNSVGTSNPSAESNSVTPVRGPDAPIIGTAMGGDAQATVTFTAPASDGGSAITGYTVTSLPAGGVDADAGTMLLSHTMTGLTNGTSYTFTVTAANSAGTSNPSAESNAVTPTSPPLPSGGGGSPQFGAPACSGAECDTNYRIITPYDILHPAATTPVEDTPTPLQPENPGCGRSSVSPVPFSDISNHWARAYIESLYRRCIIDGSTSDLFLPDGETTRAELVKIVLLNSSQGTSSFEDLFLDVKSEDWFAGYVIRAVKLGFVDGYLSLDGAAYFKPNQAISRAEALKVMLKAKVVQNLGGYTTDFGDVQTGEWFYDYVAYAEANNIIEGYTMVFDKAGIVSKFYSFPRLLGFSNQGKDVSNLKTIMAQLGYYRGEIDTYYDVDLERAISAYQSVKGIKTTGQMGYVTRRYILKENLTPVTYNYFRPNTPITRAETAKLAILIQS